MGSEMCIRDSQFAADASGRQVIAGPVEATAIGNLLIQAIATGDIKNQIRCVRSLKIRHPRKPTNPKIHLNGDLRLSDLTNWKLTNETSGFLSR